MSKFTRREFLKTSGMALAGLTIAPSSILGKSHGHISPSDKLNIAVVGIGGMGHTNINHVKNTENIVAGDTPKGYLMNSLKPSGTGTIARCTTKWASPLMPSS